MYIDEDCALSAQSISHSLSRVGPVSRQRLLQREGLIVITPDTDLAQERERKILVTFDVLHISELRLK